MSLRRETIYGVTRAQAVAEMRWACKVVKVEGGYLGFASVGDFHDWKKQKRIQKHGDTANP